MTQSLEGRGASSPFARMIDARVVDASGNPATIVAMGAEDYGGSAQQVCVRLESGAELLVPASLFSAQQDGSYRLPFTFQMPSDAQPLQLRFPVMQEELQVGKRVVETGSGVRIHKSVVEREELFDEPLMRDELVVEHVPHDRMLADGEVPQTRYEGDTLVVPVMEEVLVVQKQLRLKEEIRITRKQHEVRAPQTVVLRSEQIKVERFE